MLVEKGFKLTNFFCLDIFRQRAVYSRLHTNAQITSKRQCISVTLARSSYYGKSTFFGGIDYTPVIHKPVDKKIQQKRHQETENGTVEFSAI